MFFCPRHRWTFFVEMKKKQEFELKGSAVINVYKPRVVSPVLPRCSSVIWFAIGGKKRITESGCCWIILLLFTDKCWKRAFHYEEQAKFRSL